MRSVAVAFAAVIAGWSVPALAQVANFTLVNGTDASVTSVTIRRVGTQEWRPLSYAASPGGRAVVEFSDPDCAFDIRASVGGATVTWGGVNLCEAKAVTLNRRPGAVWVDYD